MIAYCKCDGCMRDLEREQLTVLEDQICACLGCMVAIDRILATWPYTPKPSPARTAELLCDLFTAELWARCPKNAGD
jgi:hypothetical protein